MLLAIRSRVSELSDSILIFSALEVAESYKTESEESIDFFCTAVFFAYPSFNSFTAFNTSFFVVILFMTFNEFALFEALDSLSVARSILYAAAMTLAPVGPLSPPLTTPAVALAEIVPTALT